MVQSVRASGRRLLLLVLKDEHRDDDDDDDDNDETQNEADPPLLPCGPCGVDSFVGVVETAGLSIGLSGDIVTLPRTRLRRPSQPL